MRTPAKSRPAPSCALGNEYCAPTFSQPPPFITYLISANDTSLIDWKRSVHELEMIDPGATFVDDEVVLVIPFSKVSVVEESTT